MYSIQNKNDKIHKIINKYKNNEFNNFMIISKIKKYIKYIEEFDNFKNKYFKKYKNLIINKNEEINNIKKEINKENNYKIQIDDKLKKIKSIYIDTNVNLDIVLLNYSTYTLYNKILINQFYKYKNKFFKNQPITLLNINKLKLEYRNYILNNTIELNKKKKDNKLDINKLQFEINELEGKIKRLRDEKNKLYIKNNIFIEDCMLDNKEIYILIKEILLKKKKINKLIDKKIVLKQNSEFELINLDKNQKLILPIINNNNIFHYKLQKIFIYTIKTDIELSNTRIIKNNNKLNILIKDKEYYNNLLNCRIVDNKLKNKYENIQYEMNKLESEIIKDYLVLNRKK